MVFYFEPEFRYLSVELRRGKNKTMRIRYDKLLKKPAAMLAFFLLVIPCLQIKAEQDLPKPNGQKSDMSKPVQVFIVMGEVNTLEMGRVNGGEGSLEHAVQEEGLYPFMVDEEGNWTKRKDLRHLAVKTTRGLMNIYRIDWLTVYGEGFGIEQGIGHRLGNGLDAPVLIVKSATGNRSLGWDLLPPGSERFEFEEGGKTYVYPGYKDEVRHGRWEKGNVPAEPDHQWYAGKQYDEDVRNAKKILENIPRYYPDAIGYEVAGFFWWQGDRDSRDAGQARRYGENLKTLIKTLREEFGAPEAPFVCATLGQTDRESASGAEKDIIEGMMSIDGKDNAATVYTHSLSMKGSSSNHYKGDAKTFMNVGLAMGEAMVDLVSNTGKEP